MLKKHLSSWGVLWVMLAVNIVLLALALLQDGIWYMIASLLWSLNILRYHTSLNRIKNLRRLKTNGHEYKFKRRAYHPYTKHSEEEIRD